jgi:creatinine amidohydrolase/Fe(II)-dependent formamide hydrolase-like protein
LKDIREIAPTGWYGNPANATPEKAKEFLAKVSDAAAEYIRTTLKELGE